VRNNEQLVCCASALGCQSFPWPIHKPTSVLGLFSVGGADAGTRFEKRKGKRKEKSLTQKGAREKGGGALN
jgi:hypothetical protein